MPAQRSIEDLEEIVRIIAESPESGGGCSLTELRSRLASLPRRTLQRYLAYLVDQGRLTSSGKARATRYRVPASAPVTYVAEERADYVATDSALASGECDAIRRAIRLPVQNKQSVRYNPEFLRSYRPNKTFYLDSSVRTHLAQMGRSPDVEHTAGTFARHILNRLLIDLSWNSSRLEGNTYSLLETDRLIELGEAAEGKTVTDTQMILNHKAAIELLVDQADEIAFNRYTIMNLHALLSDNLLPDQKFGGRLRRIPVGIGGTAYRPLDVPQMIEEYFDQILARATAIADPFEQAFFAMVQLPYLQPFEDVNKRVSRLAANIPLIRQNLCPLSFVGVPDRDYVDGILAVYELNRVELLRDVFVHAYERSCARYATVRQTLGEPDPFRLRYRQALYEVIGHVVRSAMDRKAAIAYVHEHASRLADPADVAQFVETAETELLALHEGNFARYRVRPAEYETWRKAWR